VHDRRQAQLPQAVELEAERPAGEVELARHLDHAAQGDALQRHRVAAPQRVQVDAVAVVGGDHGQAGEAAFGGLGLQDARQAPAAAEVEEVAYHPWILALRRGLRIQSISVRRSRITSARRSMSGCSGIRLP
jgi:hypothetical protein